MGLQKSQFKYQNGFYEFEIWNQNSTFFERLFLAWFFHFKCYGISMCGGKKL